MASPVTITRFDNQITTGFFGTVSSYQTIYPGWFDNTGSFATTIGKTENNNSALAYIAPNQLGTGSGGVFLASDAALIISYDAQTYKLINNALTYFTPTLSVPEPSQLHLIAMGFLFTYIRINTKLTKNTLKCRA
jgi:hypothetical protein